ncbi:SET and MYND domain-containing protein 3 [Gamsiella multidivaricata]|nr:SET and MYND domain-containing protein 3 [Gamsiella multidivaricata]
MDAPQQSTITPQQANTLPIAEPGVIIRTSNKAKRNYRTKKSDSDNEDDLDHSKNVDKHDCGQETKDSIKSMNSASVSSLPYVQSQSAQNIGEVYPGLARLSFLDQEQGSSDGGDTPLNTKKPYRPLHQTPRFQTAKDNLASSAEDITQAKSYSISMTTSATSVPPATSPSALSSGTGLQTSLVEIKETGSAGKGRGLFSAAKEILKPGILVFKELGYCQVVNDASLSQVCSACFKDVREELGEGDAASSSGSVPTGGQRKLVRCAGCKIACQIKDWKLHHQLECQGIQKSMANPTMKDVWVKRTMDTTTVRALCRIIRRQERAKSSVAYKAEHGKLHAAQKQVSEVYVSGLDQKEEEWLDEHGSTWIEQYLNTYEEEREAATAATSTSSSSLKGALEESSHLARTLAVAMSCVVIPKEDRHTFLMGTGEVDMDIVASARAGGIDICRKLDSYGFTITNIETTTAVGLALYVQCMPFMNHSCIPNCVYTFKGPRIECRVIRDIQPGEEMTISYIDQISTTQERQKQLKAQYRFTCHCPLCKYFPANPLIQPETEALTQIVPGPLPEPSKDPKQGFICPNDACHSINRPQSILAIESQLRIYNKVELRCDNCGQVTELTQELVKENEEEAQRLILGFVREMNDSSSPSSGSKARSRNFELAKVKLLEATEGGAAKPTIVGGIKTVQELSPRALRYFEDAYKTLTGGRATINNDSSSITENLICRSALHHLVRQLEQNGFDEAVSHKNWTFALRRSIELQRILNETYVGHHPLKAIQGYYTCKIANLLANLLLEESTIEIEESDQEKSDEEDADMLDSDDERDLKAVRDAMRKGGRAAAAVAAAASSSKAAQKQLQRTKRTGEEEESAGKMKRRAQAESSRELLQYLKSLIPMVEDPKTLQELRVCWGKDGKLASRYRHQADSLKQALHYAELPFSSH